MRVDEEGIHLDRGLNGLAPFSADVYFDDRHVWSFDATPADLRAGTVGWPTRMRRRLDGVAQVRVSQDERDLFTGDVAFGAATERVRFVDGNGLPIMIDKWGLIQRPFSGRGDGVVAEMVERTERILDVLRDECGVDAWIAFGTLLGAARGGKVIGHDSDVDLAYLSDRPTPAEMTEELYDVARALRRAGLEVVHKSGSFITVVFASVDGAEASIDIYVCFHVGDLLYETATVRTPVPRAAILPLTTIEFEGRMLPAPADVDRMLTVSYGPGWRTPDPSFRHRPGPETVRRFDGWFSSVMRQRRDWEAHLVERRRDPDHGPSDFVDWVAGALPRPTRIIEVGTGTGTDALAWGTLGHTVLGLDYARRGNRGAARRARRRRLPVTFARLNLYDLRDVLTRGALVTRRRPPRQAVCARGLLTALDADGAEHFWRFTSMALSGGGTAFVEDRVVRRPADQPADQPTDQPADRPADRPAARVPGAGGKVHPVDPDAVERQVARAGGRVVSTTTDDDRWRIVAEWPKRDRRRPGRAGVRS